MIALLHNAPACRLVLRYFEHATELFKAAEDTGRFRLAVDPTCCSPEDLELLLTEAAKAVAGENSVTALLSSREHYLLFRSALAQITDHYATVLDDMEAHFQQ